MRSDCPTMRPNDARIGVLYRSQTLGVRKRASVFSGSSFSDNPQRFSWRQSTAHETRAAAPLVDELRARKPGHRILVTHMTPTGRATGRDLFGDGVERAWLPYDLGFATRRFFAHYRPELGIVLETEIWPRLFEEAARAGIPVVLARVASGRIGAK